MDFSFISCLGGCDCVSFMYDDHLTGLYKEDPDRMAQQALLYLISIPWLSVDFDWSRANHTEGAILSCHMIKLPSKVISAKKGAAVISA